MPEIWIEPKAPPSPPMTVSAQPFRPRTRLGFNNAEIAAELYLGETTVKTHLGRVLDKLGLRDRSKAIAYAYASGLVRPDEAARPH